MRERYDGEGGVDYLLGLSTGRYNESGPSAPRFRKASGMRRQKCVTLILTAEEINTAPPYRAVPVTFNILDRMDAEHLDSCFFCDMNLNEYLLSMNT